MKSINYLILVAVVILISCSGGNTPSNTAKKMAGYLQSQNYEKFADGMIDEKNSTTEQKAQAKAMLVALLKEKAGKEITKKDGIKTIEILEEKIDDDGQTATVKIKYTYGNGEVDEQTMNFEKVDNEWKLFIKK